MRIRDLEEGRLAYMPAQPGIDPSYLERMFHVLEKDRVMPGDWMQIRFVDDGMPLAVASNVEVVVFGGEGEDST